MKKLLILLFVLVMGCSEKVELPKLTIPVISTAMTACLKMKQAGGAKKCEVFKGKKGLEVETVTAIDGMFMVFISEFPDEASYKLGLRETWNKDGLLFTHVNPEKRLVAYAFYATTKGAQEAAKLAVLE